MHLLSIEQDGLLGVFSTSTVSPNGIGIRVDHVSKTFQSQTGDVLALENIDLSVPVGSKISLLGPSGSGKTTLLHICASFETPTTGSVFLDGKPVEYLVPPVRVGVVQQRDTLFPNMTVRNNVAFGLHGSDRGRIADTWLERVGLQNFRDKWPRELSGGMRRRVELVRALAIQPTVLLLDEPFSSLDVLTREDMQMLLLQLWSDRGLTSLFATHDIEEAIFLGEEVYVLSRSPGSIAARYTIPFEYPRQPELRLTHQFIDLRAEVTARLKLEAGKEVESVQS